LKNPLLEVVVLRMPNGFGWAARSAGSPSRPDRFRVTGGAIHKTHETAVANAEYYLTHPHKINLAGEMSITDVTDHRLRTMNKQGLLLRMAALAESLVASGHAELATTARSLAAEIQEIL
jgi:hypothetical protein